MASGSLKLEIDKESYDETYGKIQALYELAQKASLAIEKAAQHRSHLTALRNWQILSFFEFCTIVVLFVALFGGK